MAFVYHKCPPDMVGTTLYPLNHLKTLHPELYTRQVAKYAGREAVLAYRIPFLDILWNDAVHTAAIHPYYLYAAWQTVGIETPFMGHDSLFFKIPLERLARYQCMFFRSEAYWINNSPHEEVPLVAPLDEFSPFVPETYRELPQVPASYVAYLRRQQERGKRPLMFPKIPHVLVPGPIDVTGVELVPVHTPPGAPG